MHAQNLNNIKIIAIKNNTYQLASNISPAESICLLESSDLTEKTGLL